MKYFVLILMLFSLQAFSHEAEDHPEYLKHTCDVDDALTSFFELRRHYEKKLTHYLTQDCDFSNPAVYFDMINSRVQEVLRITSWELYTSALTQLAELDVDFNTTFIFEGDDTSPLYHAVHSANLYDYTLTKKEYQEYLEFIEILLKNGADPNWKNEFTGWTVLMLASVKSNNTNKPLFDLLIKYGADLDNITDSEGYTGRDYLNATPPEEYDPHWHPFDNQ